MVIIMLDRTIRQGLLSAIRIMSPQIAMPDEIVDFMSFAYSHEMKMSHIPEYLRLKVSAEVEKMHKYQRELVDGPLDIDRLVMIADAMAGLKFIAGIENVFGESAFLESRLYYFGICAVVELSQIEDIDTVEVV